MALNRQPQNIRLDLHQQIITCGTAIYSQTFGALQFRRIYIDLIERVTRFLELPSFS